MRGKFDGAISGVGGGEEGMKYCIYSDSVIDEADMNPEHIIPLSLGGCNDFAIMVNKEKNGDVNRGIDEKIKNDVLVLVRRVQHDFKGHRGSAPTLKVTKAMVNGNPASWEYSKDGITLFDHINKTALQGNQTATLSVKLDLEIRGRFISKIALATGYFLFGNTFINHADHNSLRTYVFSDDVESLKLDLRFYDEFQSPGTLDIPKSDAWEINKIIASRKKSSGVIWGYAADRIVVHTFIGSTLLGMVSFSANVDEFHLDNEIHDDFGTVIRIENNKVFSQVPYRCELKEVMHYIDTLKNDTLTTKEEYPPCRQPQ